jgi:hypothetical protein
VSPMAPLLRIPVGVVVERRPAVSPWAQIIWRPVAVLGGRPEAAAWTPLASDGETATYYAGPAEIELYRSEAGNYRRNLASGVPCLWVAMHPTGGEPPYAIAAVTADPAEAEGLAEPGQAIVEAVPMPDPVRDAIAAFVADHHVEHVFEKRRRDRADPEALARHGPMYQHECERDDE